MKRTRNNEKLRRGVADTVRQAEHTRLAGRPPDSKAAADFRRPAYQASRLIQAQGKQIPDDAGT